MSPFHEKVVALHAAVPVASVQGTLALDLHPQHDPPELQPAQGRSSGDVVAIDHRARTRLEQWAHRYAQAAVEIVGGDRPVTQLLRWTAPRVYADLARRAQLVARAAGQRPGQGGVQAVRPQVVGVRTCFVEPEAAEVSAHVRYGHRSRAVALRFEIRDDRWQCVALEFA
jgi:Family of unknown function (DUF6459)